jgi:DNA-binding XRE family transcriptional regulator
MRERFEAKFIVHENGCWIWTSTISTSARGAYGSFKRDGIECKAHRVSYELYKGPIPTGLNVLHSCDESICVNPDHLFLGTQQDNIDDMIAKNRQSPPRPGEKNGNAKLDERAVTKVREMLAQGYRQRDIAAEFGVAQTTISAIKTGFTWRENINGSL